MLATAADRLPAALSELDPGSRALLDLSLRRGIPPTEIAELLRKEPAEVERSLDAVLELLADALELDGDGREQVREALSDLPDEAWQGRPPARRPPAVPRVEREEPFYFTPKEERPKAWPIALLVLLVSGLVVTSILVFSGGGSEEEDSPPAPDARQPPEVEGRPPAEPGEKPRTVHLAPVGDTRAGSGRITLSPAGDRLAISIKGLPKPRGAYELWVYSSVVDAQSLGSFRDTKIELDARLPDNFQDYRYVDVSLEPPDGNPNHSGDSVLRASLDELVVG